MGISVQLLLVAIQTVLIVAIQVFVAKAMKDKIKDMSTDILFNKIDTNDNKQVIVTLCNKIKQLEYEIKKMKGE